MNVVVTAVVPTAVTEPLALSVVVPAYNESARIESGLRRVVEFFDGRRLAWELIVVDDGSSDDTALVVEQFAAQRKNTRLVRLPVNQGKGAALRAGVLATTGARVLMMDADLSTPIEEIDTLARALDGGAQVATGSRALATSNVKRPQSPLRVLFGRAGNLWIRLLAVPGVHDTQCGFKLFEGDAARRLFALCKEKRFGIDIEVLCLARRRFNYEIVEVGVCWEHRDGSKVKLRDYIDVLVGVPRIVWSVVRS